MKDKVKAQDNICPKCGRRGRRVMSACGTRFVWEHKNKDGWIDRCIVKKDEVRNE